MGLHMAPSPWRYTAHRSASRSTHVHGWKRARQAKADPATVHTDAECAGVGYLWPHAETDIEIHRQLTPGITDVATWTCRICRVLPSRRAAYDTGDRRIDQASSPRHTRAISP